LIRRGHEYPRIHEFFCAVVVTIDVAWRPILNNRHAIRGMFVNRDQLWFD